MMIMIMIIIIIIITQQNFLKAQQIFTFRNECAVNLRLRYSHMQPHPPPPVTQALTSFCGTESSLPCSQQLGTDLYPEPHKSSTHPPNQFLLIHFNILLPPSPIPSTRSLLSGIPSDIPPPCLVPPMHASHSAPLFPIIFKINSKY